MLNKDLLSQLSELKSEIRASRDLQQGTVRGTSGRFGFVNLDDGREAFLNPEQMERVFHGDRVEVLVTKNNADKFEAKLEQLLHSPLKQIAGKYCVKGKGHFVIVEHQQHSHWVFVPPKMRGGAQDGHYVTARITQHPYQSGKAQAKIAKSLGTEVNVDTVRQFTLAKFQLFENFSKEVMEQAKVLAGQTIEGADRETRTDYRDKDFITIDSANTRDMDDALAIEALADGWKLSVAIADPGSEILADSPLDIAAMRRAQTLYMPGKPVTMLPEALAHERYSLVAKQDRRALVCELEIEGSGKLSQCRFRSGLIQSKAKLSYHQVTALLEGKDYSVPPQLDDAQPFKTQLESLHQCVTSLRSYRQQHQLINDNRDDFYLVINDKGKVEKIEKLVATMANILVEEAMVLTNQCAGQFLAEHHAGLCLSHPGYKEERREDIEKLLKESLGDDEFGSTEHLQDFVRNIQRLKTDKDKTNLLAIQQRFLQSSELSTEAKPHFGMGVAHYANITSPIRRYQDLLNQRVIHRLIAESDSPHTKKNKSIKAGNLSRLNETVNNNRSATRFMEQWLVADYMQDKIGQRFQGYIALLTNQGVGVRLVDTGVEGFIAAQREDKGKDKATESKDKISFNNQRMELNWNGRALFYDQVVEVVLTAVDMEKRKMVFAWSDSELQHFTMA